MKLSAWRETVSYGAHLQPVHLHVVGSDAEHASPCTGPKLSSPPSQNSPQTSPKSALDLCNGTSSPRDPLETPIESNGTQAIVSETVKAKNVIVIPPFTSEIISNDEQMVLNVGGPVWAMDWVPSLPAANSEDVAAVLAKFKPRKAGRVSTASRIGSKKALNGDKTDGSETAEDVDGVRTAASSDPTKNEGDDKMKWRFLALSTHPPCLVKEGKVVKPTPPDHYYDVPEGGQNLIQIWAVPLQQTIVAEAGKLWRKRTAKKTMVKPRIVYAIDHDSGVAWDLQWCPLVKKFPKCDRREGILGILAVCFGDGSVKVFEIPAVLEERLQPELDTAADCVVEKANPIVVATVPHIMQLSVRWSPHHWNMLLTGGSDGSVSLWNITSAVKRSDTAESRSTDQQPVEPQRRFQDADTIGKQEALDWGCGWVAVRAVAWSPFDQHIFATTGNDSVFKVWDIREPRVCLRSHRIRSTWGLALQWLDQTSIHISGDQGSVYMYDILSGSYQKLHFHPQIDSPVWDLQLARRGPVPLLVSSCTSGSIRAAPAKRLYRAPQNCVELCRLSGEKDSSAEKPFKSLTVSFARQSVLATADSAGQGTREFRERDAALHRLRLTSSTAGDYPCFLAAGGHAGLVILLELHEVLDTLIATFFSPPKKVSRSKNMVASRGSNHSMKAQSMPAGGESKDATDVGRKTMTLGSFAKATGVHAALDKSATKPLTCNGKGKAKARSRFNLSDTESFIEENDELETNAVDQEEEEEEEFKEEDEGDDDSELSLVTEDSSDDDHASGSDDDDAVEDAETSATNEDQEEARLMKEYQMDLSEDDAYLLALQMSRTDATPAAAVLATDDGTPPAPTLLAGQDVPTNPLHQEKLQKTLPSAKAAETAKAKAKTTKTATKITAATEAKPALKPSKGKKRARPASFTLETMAEPSPVNDMSDANIAVNKKSEVQLDGKDDRVAESSSFSAVASTGENKAGVATSTKSSAVLTKARTKQKQPAKAFARKKTAKTKGTNPRRFRAADQAMVLQAFEYQMGMCEEDALKEAFRLSVEDKHRSLRAEQPPPPPKPASGALPTPTQSKLTPATPRAKKSSQKQQKKVEEVKGKVESAGKVAAPADEDAQHQRPQTPRRLQFLPHDDSESENQAAVVTVGVGQVASVAEPAAFQIDAASTAVAPPKKSFTKGSPVVKSANAKSVQQEPSAKYYQRGTTTPKEVADAEQAESASTAVSTTPAGKVSAKRPKSTGARIAGPAKKRKKTATAPRSRRRSSNEAVQSDCMSEGDALLLALKMSEVEY